VRPGETGPGSRKRRRVSRVGYGSLPSFAPLFPSLRACPTSLIRLARPRAAFPPYFVGPCPLFIRRSPLSVQASPLLLGSNEEGEDSRQLGRKRTKRGEKRTALRGKRARSGETRTKSGREGKAEEVGRQGCRRSQGRSVPEATSLPAARPRRSGWRWAGSRRRLRGRRSRGPRVWSAGACRRLSCRRRPRPSRG
jgi:hypothetical protein